MSGTPITTTEVRDVLSMRNETEMPIKEIAAARGCHQRRIRKILKTYNTEREAEIMKNVRSLASMRGDHSRIKKKPVIKFDDDSFRRAYCAAWCP